MLSSIYWEMCFLRDWHYVQWNYTGIPIWLQMKYGFTRWQARKLSRILWEWFKWGYVPSSITRALRRGKKSWFQTH